MNPKPKKQKNRYILSVRHPPKYQKYELCQSIVIEILNFTVKLFLKKSGFYYFGITHPKINLSKKWENYPEVLPITKTVSPVKREFILGLEYSYSMPN